MRCAVSTDHKCLGMLTLVLKTVTDGDVLMAVFTSASRALLSARHDIWFQQRNLKFMEVLLLMYDIVRRVPAHAIYRDLHFDSATITEWAKLCRESMMPSATGKRNSASPCLLPISTFGRIAGLYNRQLNSNWGICLRLKFEVRLRALTDLTND